jgi:CheY-like chemotaxis protein
MVNKVFMIIDDDEDDRFFFKEALADLRNSPRCLEAINGEDALNQLRKIDSVPDFIFLDVNMPRMAGRECLIEIKRDAKLKNCVVVMYSTSFSEETIKEFVNFGASTCLQKPTDINKLHEQILDVVNKSTNIPR